MLLPSLTDTHLRLKWDLHQRELRRLPRCCDTVPKRDASYFFSKSIRPTPEWFITTVPMFLCWGSIKVAGDQVIFCRRASSPVTSPAPRRRVAVCSDGTAAVTALSVKW